MLALNFTPFIYSIYFLTFLHFHNTDAVLNFYPDPGANRALYKIVAHRGSFTHFKEKGNSVYVELSPAFK